MISLVNDHAIYTYFVIQRTAPNREFYPWWCTLVETDCTARNVVRSHNLYFRDVWGGYSVLSGF